MSETIQYPGIMKISLASAEKLIKHIDTHDDSPYNVVAVEDQYWSISPDTTAEVLMQFYKQEVRNVAKRMKEEAP